MRGPAAPAFQSWLLSQAQSPGQHGVGGPISGTDRLLWLKDNDNQSYLNICKMLRVVVADTRGVLADEAFYRASASAPSSAGPPHSVASIFTADLSSSEEEDLALLETVGVYEEQAATSDRRRAAAAAAG